jgi:hypothetical protein
MMARVWSNRRRRHTHLVFSRRCRSSMRVHALSRGRRRAPAQARQMRRRGKSARTRQHQKRIASHQRHVSHTKASGKANNAAARGRRTERGRLPGEDRRRRHRRDAAYHCERARSLPLRARLIALVRCWLMHPALTVCVATRCRHASAQSTAHRAIVGVLVDPPSPHLIAPQPRCRYDPIATRLIRSIRFDRRTLMRSRVRTADDDVNDDPMSHVVGRRYALPSSCGRARLLLLLLLTAVLLHIAHTDWHAARSDAPHAASPSSRSVFPFSFLHPVSAASQYPGLPTPIDSVHVCCVWRTLLPRDKLIFTAGLNVYEYDPIAQQTTFLHSTYQQFTQPIGAGILMTEEKARNWGRINTTTWWSVAHTTSKTGQDRTGRATSS